MIKEYLENAVVRSKMSHAYIIEGKSPELRQKAADEFIRVLMGRDEHAMAQIKAGSHPDIIRVEHEKPLTISVREVREQICDTMGIRPFEGGWKLYIMDEAELMPPGAQNALLKTIEEPSEYGCMILMTSNQEMLLDTIRSRCITLKCDHEEEPEEFFRPELAADITFDTASRREHIDAARAAEITGEVLAEGPGQLQKFTGFLRERICELMKAGSGSDAFDMTRAYRALELIDEAETRIKFNVNAELTIQMMLMEI